MNIILDIKEIFKYRAMIKGIVNKDLRTRYRGSFLGFLWTFLNPLMQLVIYSLIFPYLLRFQIENYAMFMFVCLVPWIYFNTTAVGSCSLIINNSNLVTKIYFPRIILPISFTMSAFINMLLSYLIVIPMLLLFGISITWNILWLIPVFLIETLICLGISMFFSAVNVYFRDVEHILGILIMGLYFFTPILYSLDIFGQNMLPYFEMNPLTNIMLAIRDAALYGKAPDIISLRYPLIFGIAALAVGYATFQRLQRKFAEVI